MGRDPFELAMQRINDIYAEYKLGPDVYFKAPESRPKVQSDQIKALVSFLVERGVIK
jgi:hypothetical protein